MKWNGKIGVEIPLGLCAEDFKKNQWTRGS